MSMELYSQLNRDAQNYSRYKWGMYAGSLGVSYLLLQPTSVLGYVGTTAVSFVGGVVTLIVVDLAKKKFEDLSNDYWYRAAPKLIDRKAVPRNQFDQALIQVKKTEAFQALLQEENLNEEKAAEQLYEIIKKGFCQGQSFELLSQLKSNYSLSCRDLLHKVSVEAAICNQLSYQLKDQQFTRSKMPRTIGGNFYFETLPASAAASFYQNIVENSLKKVDATQVIAGEVRLMRWEDNINGHVITFQYSDGFYRYYDAEKGFYSYPSKTSFFSHLRTSILGNYSQICSNGYGLKIQIVVYAIDKKESQFD